MIHRETAVWDLMPGQEPLFWVYLDSETRQCALTMIFIGLGYKGPDCDVH